MDVISRKDFCSEWVRRQLQRNKYVDALGKSISWKEASDFYDSLIVKAEEKLFSVTTIGHVSPADTFPAEAAFELIEDPENAQARGRFVVGLLLGSRLLEKFEATADSKLAYADSRRVRLGNAHLSYNQLLALRHESVVNEDVDLLVKEVALQLNLQRLEVEYTTPVSRHFPLVYDVFRADGGNTVNVLGADYGVSLETFASTDDSAPGVFPSLIFQVGFSLEAAVQVLGLIGFTSLVWKSVFVKDVSKDSRFANKTWAYKRDGHAEFYFLTPEMHKNKLAYLVFDPQMVVGFHAAASTVRFVSIIGQMVGRFTTMMSDRNRHQGPWRDLSRKAVRDQNYMYDDWMDKITIVGDIPRQEPKQGDVMTIIMGLVPSQQSSQPPEKDHAKVYELDQAAGDQPRQPKKKRVDSPMGIACAMCRTSQVTSKAGDAYFCGEHCYQAHFGQFLSS